MGRDAAKRDLRAGAVESKLKRPKTHQLHEGQQEIETQANSPDIQPRLCRLGGLFWWEKFLDVASLGKGVDGLRASRLIHVYEPGS